MAKLFKYGPISLGSRTTGHTLGSQQQQSVGARAQRKRQQTDKRMGQAAQSLQWLLGERMR